MSFIEIIENKDDFINIEKFFSKKIDKQFIKIEEDNIENFKNILFETIVILNKISQSKQKYLESICRNARYLVINTDIDLKLENQNENNIITFGINQLSTVTISSVTEDRVLISQQRNIVNVKKQIVEAGEKVVNSRVKNNSRIYNNLLKYIIEKIYI